MNSELENPFSVTKATEFSDQEIFEYWVNFNTIENVSFDTLLNPKEFLPKYVIGGKGCGKTHILRYYSFPLQKIRNETIIELLTLDKYIGIYSIFHGLNSSRFSGKGIEDSEWESIFEYYFELYICDNLLRTLKEVLDSLKISSDNEKRVVASILNLFSNRNELNHLNSINSILEYLQELRRKIDFQILNAAFTRKLDYEEIKVLFSPGDLLFGIPASSVATVYELRDIKFIYIFDEYEKLYEWQKIFINTLVWDKKSPVTFWIGARRHGYTTRMTKSGQEMKKGSEFQNIDLDLVIRSNEDLYKGFAEELYTNRLIKYYESKGLRLQSADVKRNFKSKFEEYSDDKILDIIIRKNNNKEFVYLRALRTKLEQVINTSKVIGIKTNKDVNNIIDAIKQATNGNPLLQKFKLFYFYKVWYSTKKNDKYQDIIKVMNNEFDKYLKRNSESEFYDIVDKRKKDFIAHLCKDYKLKNYEYSGIEDFIKISQGNSRSFILILKKIIEFARIRGEKPLEEGGSISLDSQYLAVYDTAKWFFEDAELNGDDGRNVYTSLKRLADYFVIERFCDKPVDTTVSSFYLKTEVLSNLSINNIEIMKMHSFLIEDLKGRKEKNSGRIERKFELNKMLAPLWNLPIVVRGTLSFSNELAESIFDVGKVTLFNNLHKKRKSELNAPDFLKTNLDENTLFN